MWENGLRDAFDKSCSGGNLKKENYDMADAATCVIGYVNMNKLEKSGN